MRISNRLIGFVLLASLSQVALLWWSDVPLGVRGEWTWPRMSLDAGVWATIATGVLAVAVYTTLVRVGGRRMSRAGTVEATGWLAALFLAGCAWLWIVIETTPGPLALGRGPFIIYYQRTSGYFLQARGGLEDWPGFLAGYEEELEKGDVLHLGTHPPGLAMGYAFLLHLCREHPTVTDAVLASQPETVRQATQQLERNESQLVPPLGRADAACLWLAALLTLLCAVAAVWPLYGLLARIADRPAAWHLTALWPLVPSVAVFFPKSDLLYPFIAMLFAWLWLTGWERGAPWRCGLAAVIFLGGLLLSLAFLPVAAIIGLATLIQWRFGSGQPTLPGDRPQLSGARRAACLAVPITLFVAGVAAFWMVWDVNPFNVWRLNFINHAEFYQQFPRTWWKWLLVNPLELAIAAGAVVSVLALAGTARCFTAPLRSPLALSVVLVWAALWLSGKNMGEAGRLWILMMPWLLVVAAAGLGRSDERGAFPSRGTILLIVLQAVLCFVTAHRVDGFHFEEVLEQSQAAESSPLPGDDLDGMTTLCPDMSGALEGIEAASSVGDVTQTPPQSTPG